MKRRLCLLILLLTAFCLAFTACAENTGTVAETENPAVDAGEHAEEAAEPAEETEDVTEEAADSETGVIPSFNRAISFDAESYVIYKGKPSKVTATVTNLAEDAPKKTTLTWTSSDPDVVTVNPTGALTGKKAGKAVISVAAKDDPAITASVEIEVRVPVQTVAINEKGVSVIVGAGDAAATVQLTTSVKPEDAFYKTGTWTSSDEKVAKVDENGVVRGVAAGSAKITFTSDDPGAKKVQTVVKVNQAVTRIRLSTNSLTLDKGKTSSIKAEVLPNTAAAKKVTWSSSNENVAVVSANGGISAKGKGTATITCTATDGSGVKATCNVSVISMVKSMRASGSSKSTLFAGQTDSFAVSVEPYDATDKSVSWTSSDSSVASVDSTGKITAKSKGQCKVTATAKDGSGKKVDFNVTVEPAVPITLESLGYGIFMPNLLGLTVKNHCQKTSIKNFTFDITLHTGWGTESGSYNLGKDVQIGPGAKKTIKRNHFGVGYASKITITITGVVLKDGTHYSIPSNLRDTWTFSR